MAMNAEALRMFAINMKRSIDRNEDIDLNIDRDAMYQLCVTFLEVEKETLEVFLEILTTFLEEEGLY